MLSSKLIEREVPRVPRQIELLQVSQEYSRTTRICTLNLFHYPTLFKYGLLQEEHTGVPPRTRSQATHELWDNDSVDGRKKKRNSQDSTMWLRRAGLSRNQVVADTAAYHQALHHSYAALVFVAGCPEHLPSTPICR